MRKITTILSIIAVAASTLFMSCAKSKTPDVVEAFPSNKKAAYSHDDEGNYSWSFKFVENGSNVDYSYEPYNHTSSPKPGGFELIKDGNHPEWVNYWFAVNCEWIAEIVEGKEYIELFYGQGYPYGDPEKYACGSIISSSSLGIQDLQIRVKNLPTAEEGDKECVIELEMHGQRMPMATIILQAQL